MTVTAALASTRIPKSCSTVLAAMVVRPSPPEASLLLPLRVKVTTSGDPAVTVPSMASRLMPPDVSPPVALPEEMV